MADDEFFSRLGHKLDRGDASVKAGEGVGVGFGLAEGALFGAELGTMVLPGIGTAVGAVAGAVTDAVLFGAVGALVGGVSKTAKEEWSLSTARKTTPDDKPVEHASPTPTTPKTYKEKIAELQVFLKEAGYGSLLTRHGEKNGGIDGLRGRDLVAAENQYRKDHHLAANEALAGITGGEPHNGELKAQVTPVQSHNPPINKGDSLTRNV
jgi:hypothetical protein